MNKIGKKGLICFISDNNTRSMPKKAIDKKQTNRQKKRKNNQNESEKRKKSFYRLNISFFIYCEFVKMPY